ncbi:MAG: hypothetical protein RLZZ282_999 [Verrucomicrobiota bacterium]
MTAKTRVTWLLRLLVSTGLLTWIVTRPEVGKLGAEWHRMDLKWLLGGWLCAGLAQALSAWRWQACLEALGMQIPLGRLLGVTLAGSAAGCFSVGALGTDLAKMLLAGSELRGRQGGVLSSLALDHASAIPCVALMVTLAVLTHGGLPIMSTPGAWPLLALVVVIVAITTVVSWKCQRFHVEIMRVLVNRATWRGFLIAAMRSVPMWLAFCGIYYCAARAFGVAVPVVGFAGVIAIADGVASLPITIGGLGVREQAFQSLLLNWYGVVPASAIALSLTGFALTLAWAAIGAFCLGGRFHSSEKSQIS